MATSSFSKTFVVKDDIATDALLEAVKDAASRPARPTNSFRFADKETLVKKISKRYVRRNLSPYCR